MQEDVSQVQQAQRGDAGAFAALSAAYRSLVLATVRRYGADDAAVAGDGRTLWDDTVGLLSDD